MSLEENKALVRLIIEEGFNRGNLDIAEGRFSDDYVVHAPGRDLPTGPQAFRASMRTWRGAFGDLHMTVHDMVAEGDFVVNRFTTRGTHTGYLMGFPPTGRQMLVHGQEMHRVVDGRVTETWVGDDVPSILVQLGIISIPRV